MIEADIRLMMKPKHYTSKVETYDGEIQYFFFTAINHDHAFDIMAEDLAAGLCDTQDIWVELDNGQYTYEAMSDYEYAQL